MVEPYAGIDTSRLLLAGMRVAQDNHRFIANNIANVETPGYNPVSLDFQATLRNAIEGRGRIELRRTRPRHLTAERFDVALQNLVFQSRSDYNKVDIDREIANLSKNTGRFTTYGSLLTKQFQMVTRMLANER